MDVNHKMEIKHTKNWLQDIIIAHNICPFAKREFDRDSIHYELLNNSNAEEQLQTLISTCKLLDSDEKIETALIIIPHGLNDFDDYLDFLAMSNALLERQGYEGIYQLASFHPNYCFEGATEDDASNYTNRAPYPTLHLIREASLEKVLKSFPNPEKIPERNIDYTRQLGLEVMQKMLNDCQK